MFTQLILTTVRWQGVRPVSLAALAVIVSLLITVLPVAAHFGITPAQAPADANSTFSLRVPNEKDDQPTVRVRVEFPQGVTVSRFLSLPGWTRVVDRDSQQRITAVTWSGGQIRPAEFQDFVFIARTPKEEGSLVFRAYQSYQGGETVEWTGAQGGERPAPVVTVQGPQSAASGGGPATASPQATGGAAPGAAAGTATGNPGSDVGVLLGLGALSLAAISLILSIASLVRRTR